jgi:hypothetical protein
VFFPLLLFFLCVPVIGLARLVWRKKCLADFDRGEVLFWSCIVIASVWAGAVLDLAINQELFSAYGQSVFWLATLIGIILGGLMALGYLLWPSTPKISIHKSFVSQGFDSQGFDNGFALRFDLELETSGLSIEALEIHVAADYGRPITFEFAPLDLREYVGREVETGKNGEPVSRTSLLRYDKKRFTLITFLFKPDGKGGWIRRAYLKVVADPSKRFKFEDMEFASLYPKLAMRFVGLRDELEQQYLVVWKEPPWKSVYEAVELLDVDSRRAKKLMRHTPINWSTPASQASSAR